MTRTAEVTLSEARKEGARKSTKRTTAVNKQSEGFTAEERAAMKPHAGDRR